MVYGNLGLGDEGEAARARIVGPLDLSVRSGGDDDKGGAGDEGGAEGAAAGLAGAVEEAQAEVGIEAPRCWSA